MATQNKPYRVMGQFNAKEFKFLQGYAEANDCSLAYVLRQAVKKLMGASSTGDAAKGKRR